MDIFKYFFFVFVLEQLHTTVRQRTTTHFLLYFFSLFSVICFRLSIIRAKLNDCRSNFLKCTCFSFLLCPQMYRVGYYDYLS